MSFETYCSVIQKALYRWGRLFASLWHDWYIILPNNFLHLVYTIVYQTSIKKNKLNFFQKCRGMQDERK